MTIGVDVAHRQGAFALTAAFEAGSGVTALFGPSGAGKTTLVNIVAGLVRPERGRVTVDGECWVDTERGVFLPPHRRRLGYIFQEARLFPHLTVRQNLGYGRWFASGRTNGESLERVVDMLGIGDLLGRRPRFLSGGEQQRVAIGRALLANPRLLLMDEPLVGLDAARKAEILPYIERLRDETGLPILFVSHSVEDVARLATTVVTLAGGRVSDTGPAATILQRSRSYAAEDANEVSTLIEARVTRHLPDFGISELDCAAGTLRAPLVSAGVGTRLRLRIRARDVILATAKPESISALNCLEGVVHSLDDPESDPTVDVRVACGGLTVAARITRFSRHTLGIEAGVPVFAIVKSISFDQHTLFASRATNTDP